MHIDTVATIVCTCANYNANHQTQEMYVIFKYRDYSNTMYAKKIISILTFARFSGKGHQSLH